VRIRPLGANETGPLLEIFAGLGVRSRKLRFLVPQPRVTAAQLRHLADVDGRDRVGAATILLLIATATGFAGTALTRRSQMANSPALLQGYLDFASALGSGVLPAATAELLALTVAQANTCEYCLSAHTYLAEHVAHLGAEEVTAARGGEHTDSKVNAILTLEAGGERKAYYRPLRIAASSTFAIGLCFSIWFVGRGTRPGATHSQDVAGVIALVFFGVAVILFVLWWWVSGLKMRVERAPCRDRRGARAR
jgi:AhpD family alkylhydroperoxidase